MEWLEWGEAAFDEARARRAPTLLLVHARWCRFCRDLRERVLVDERVVDALRRDFVCIAAERDDRPDLAARYSRGGWPTLAFLDEHGELLAADGFLEVDELLARLALVAGYFAEQRASVHERSAAHSAQGEHGAVARAELNAELLEQHARWLCASADPVHGGWGSPHKFAHPQSLEYSLLRWSHGGDELMRKLVLRTLCNVQTGEIHDRVEGGFYRCATAQDWSGPHHAKLLDANAEWLRAYAGAFQALKEQSFRGTAESTLAWLLDTLLDRRTGAFGSSQLADPLHAHLRTRAARAAHGAPECDESVYADGNALAASALFAAGDAFGKPDCAEHALRALEFVLQELYDPHRGVLHGWRGAARPPILLRDQSLTLAAILDAFEHTGRARYLGFATELASLTVERLASEEGGFWDLRLDPRAHGALRRRRRSLADNARMAQGLLRLSFMTLEPRWHSIAKATLESFAGEFQRHGHAASTFAQAAHLLLEDTVHVLIVGEPEHDDTRALQRAALASYAGQRIVQLVPPSDTATLARFELPTGSERAQAYVRCGSRPTSMTAAPERLPSLLTRLEYV
ncbi:MAG: thioredoxin domain-containing protein [Planctomycetes bacterium]|nr:thioredoxin domain-containing protein [Planctomycetota bacterium]